MAQPIMMQLHALADDWALNAPEFLEKDTEFVFTAGPFYLTDELGNKLTDELGNYLIAYNETNVFPLMLHAAPDDWSLTDLE